MLKNHVDFLRVSYLGGPNIWTYYPVIEAWADIGTFENYPSNKLDGLYERLTNRLPGLITHRCSVGEHGGFLQRLREGTWIGHIIEHVALELQELAGMPAGFGRTRETFVPGIYKIVIQTFQEEVGRAALYAARDLIMASIENYSYDIESVVEQLADLVGRTYLGPSTLHIIEACNARKIPWIRLNDSSLVQLGYGNCQHRIWTAVSDKTGVISESIASDKHLTKSLLKMMGVPVPEGCVVDDPEEAWISAQNIGLPVTIKPSDSNHGKGVMLNLSTREAVFSGYELAKNYTDGDVIVEQFIPGNEYRLLVVDQCLVAAAGGHSAWVIGDGYSNILNLVNMQINTDPLRSARLNAPLYLLNPIADPLITQELKEQGYTIDSVPRLGEKIIIIRSGNLEFDVTEVVHPTFVEAAKLATRIIGLDIAGIDLVASDISTSMFDQRAAFIEVNAGPGLSCHITTRQGSPCKAGLAIVDHLFSPGMSGRIPIIGITGSSDTTLTARLIAWLLQKSGKHVGLACKNELFVGDRQISEEKTMNWPVGRQLLINPLVECAVIENDPRMILSQGLAYDWCDVGVVTNQTKDDTLDAYYIQDSDDLYKVLRTQVDVVLPNGAAILNADDPFVLEMARHCDGKVILYSMTPTLEAIDCHRAKGNTCVFLRNGNVIIATDNQENTLLALSSLKHEMQIQTKIVLPAIAAGLALNIEPKSIIIGLETFCVDL